MVRFMGKFLDASLHSLRATTMPLEAWWMTRAFSIEMATTRIGMRAQRVQ
jgi:hypothetical protein